MVSLPNNFVGMRFKAKIKLLLLGIASRFIEIPPTDLLAKNKNLFFLLQIFHFSPIFYLNFKFEKTNPSLFPGSRNLHAAIPNKHFKDGPMDSRFQFNNVK